MDRLFFMLGSLSAFLAVALGAFGAHALKARLPADLLAVAWAHTRWPGAVLTTGGWLFVAGTVFFSGSLYLMTLTGTRWLGAVTPIGGVAWLAAWLCLAWAAWRG